MSPTSARRHSAILLQLVRKYPHKKDSIWLLVVLSLFCFSACRPIHQARNDELNEQAYAFHYRNLDSTAFYARQALTSAGRDNDVHAEALNHLAFVHIMRMEYQQACLLLDSISRLTDNQLELLIANIQQMRLCQRQSRNKDFYEYERKAKQSLQRIEHDGSMLSPHQQRRLLYARSEYAIVSSTYYYYAKQEKASIDALNVVSEEELRGDTAQLINYLYQIGAGGVIVQGSTSSIFQQEWDILMKCYRLSRQASLPFWEANTLQALSEHLYQNQYGDQLMADNPADIRLLNIDQMPPTHLAGYLAQRSLEMFVKYGDVYQMAGAFRSLAACYWNIGDFPAAIQCLEQALHNDEAILQAPDLVMSLHEQLSLSYSAIDNKPQSDVNRNAYLDLQKATRQDSHLEARAEQLRHSSHQLNVWIVAVMLMILVVIVSIFVFSYLRRQKNRKQSLSKLLQPLQEWKNDNMVVIRELNDKCEEIEEALQLQLVGLDKGKRRYMENRAKQFLVNSVTPFIDRILHEINRLQQDDCSAEVRAERFAYMTELTDRINDYNQVLTSWIQLQQGQLSLHIESFPLQELFDIMKRSRASFRMRQVELVVEDTDAVVKADRILTLFMLNTLSDNARKFTSQGGSVTISAHVEDSYVEISVVDTGKGIPSEQLSDIFNHKIHGGHGFGLMNCKGIIDKYRKVSQLFSVCKIDAESRVGEGSRFFFRLPVGAMRKRAGSLSRALLCGALLLSSTVASAISLPSEKHLDFPNVPSQCVDSVYQCNVTHRFADALSFASEALYLLNDSYKESHPGGIDTLCITSQNSLKPADLLWLRDSIRMDFSMLLFLRNEIAVAALAQHDWQMYRYNNSLYTQLYKELSADRTLGAYVEQMQQSEQNKNVAIALLFLLLVVLLVAYYILYYRHLLYYRFCEERIEEINAMLLSEHHPESAMPSPSEQLAALDKAMNVSSYEPLPAELQSIVDEIRQTLQLAAQTDEQHRMTLEMAQDQLRQTEYESQKLYVANNVLDNCLSALKHETMYYPSRIAQLVESMKEQFVPEDTLQQLSEVASYYRELHALLAEQAMRQLSDVRIHPATVSLSQLGITFNNIAVLGDKAMLQYMFELIGRLSEKKFFSSSISENAPKYVIINISMPQLAYRDFFTPSLDNIPLLIVRQIVRDHSEASHLRGCGVVAVAQDGGTVFSIKLPRSISSS